MEQGNLSESQVIFLEAFKKIEVVKGEFLAYHPEYASSHGHLRGAVNIPLDQGEEALMLDRHGRKCILIGTLFGTVVVFERYRDAHSRTQLPIAVNYPSELATFGLLSGDSRLTERELASITGSTSGHNIGQKLKLLLHHAKVVEYVRTHGGGKQDIKT